MPSTWEPILKKNLALASRCAAFEQMPTENIAIIANVDKWSVVRTESYSLHSKFVQNSKYSNFIRATGMSN